MKDRTKDGYVDWLNTYEWNWACSLNFRNGIRRKSANGLWREWIIRLEEIEGHRLSWARMAEVGQTSGKLHFHGVVAGLHRTWPSEAESLWLHMAGDARIDLMDSIGWIEYMLKEMEDTDDFDFDANLEDVHLRPTFRQETADLPSVQAKRRR
jgi:hypothetical protein